jgi:transposase InsO family protein
LLAYHNSSINGAHFGKDRTYYKIRDRYYWPRMYEDIAQHVRSCPNCSINKQSRRKPNGYLNSVIPPEGVWENLSMDFVGPITPLSSSGNKYILVITDLLSKFVIAKATRDNSALSAAKVLVEEVILKYGSPNQILTDNGTHFTAELFNSILSLYGICHVFTTPYHPQANGVCERFNASMCDSLASICNNKRTDWDEQLSKTTFAYNTNRHVSTKLTPFEMMFGRLCKLPFDLPKHTTTVIQPHQYMKQLEEYLRIAKEMACTSIEISQKNQNNVMMLIEQTNYIQSVILFISNDWD